MATSHFLQISLALFTSIFALNSSAYNSNTFKQSWATRGTFSQRFMVLKSNPIVIATMTNSSESSEVTSEEKLVAGLKKLTGIDKWKTEIRDNYTSYEAYGKEQARLFKFLVRKEDNRINYSLASIRIAYLFPSYYETEILQREYLKVKDTKVSKWLWDKVIPQAHAKAVTGVDIQNLLQHWNSGMDGLAGLPKSVDGTTAAINATSNSIDGTTNAINGIKGVFTPGNVAKLSTVAGMGFAFGEMATHLIADGVMWAVPKGYNFLMGSVDDETRALINSRSKGEIEKLEKLTKQTVELDQKMAIHLVAMSSLADGKSPEDLAYQISVLENTRDQKEQDFKRTNDRCSFDEKSALDSTIQLLKESQNILQKTRATRAEDLCQEFENMQKEWIEAEDEMQLARTAILEQTADIFKNASDEVNARVAKFTSSRQDKTSCEKDSNLDAASDAVGEKNCNCSKPKESDAKECSAICEKKKAAEAYIANCLSQLKANKENSAELSISANKAAASAIEHRNQKITKMLNKLRKSDCRMDSESKLCKDENGKPVGGEFTALRTSMHNKFNSVAELCDRPDFTFKNKDLPEVATGELPQNPQETPSFFKRLFNW